MDLSTLTKLRREQLDSYARRVGLEQPERLSSAELLATLLNQRVQDADRALRSAGGSNAAQVARGVLSALSQSKLMRRFARPAALVASNPAAPIATPISAPVATPTPPTEQPFAVEPVTAGEATHRAAAEVVAPTVAEVVAPAVAEVVAPKAADTATREIVAHDDGVPTRRFVEEPIRTRSMARLLLAQGHRDRAIAILESIALANPHDVAARDDLERLRADVPLDPELARLPEPHALPTLPDTGDAIELRALPGRELHISWTTTEAGQARANAVLGTDGELALRVVAITPDPTRVVRSEITERAPVERIQQWTAPSVAAGSRCFAAIGMRAGGRFVAIAHAPARTID